MFKGRKWSPLQKQILLAETKHVAVDGGRRFGKSYVSAARFLRRGAMHHKKAIEQLRSGEIEPWRGAGLPKHDARHIAPHIEMVVLTGREKHLEQCRNYIASYYAGTKARFLHPDMAWCDGHKQMWLYYGGVSRRIRFVVGSGVAAVVSNAIAELWVDEAGLLDGMIMDAIRPVLWENPDAGITASGTPSMGVEHWFSSMCLSGLDPGHPYYMDGVIDRDPDTTTVIGTSYDAFLPHVRAEARKEADRLGEDWERQWILGDWRLPSLFIYDEWDPRTHIRRYDPHTHILTGVDGEPDRRLPAPSSVVGVIDWAYSTTKPGAACVYHVWRTNPFRRDSKLPLVIVVADLQVAQDYTRSGWYGDLARLRDHYGVTMWWCDPSRAELVANARKYHSIIGPVMPASKADKAGRIMLVRAHLRGDPPSLIVSEDRCENLPRQFANYRKKLDIRGNVLEQTIDHDDHCLDCCAFLMGMITQGGYSRLLI